MGILRDGIKELIHNFTSKIDDNNIANEDISDDNFIAIAKASGTSLDDIALLQKTRNGVQLSSKAKARTKNSEPVEQNSELTQQISLENKNRENDGREGR